MPKRSTTPAVVERCVARVAERLLPERGARDALSGAYAICTAQAQRRGVLKPGTRSLTAAGRSAERSAQRRPGLARAERAVARMARDARKTNGNAHDALVLGIGNDTGVTRPVGPGYTLRVERYRDAVRVHFNTESMPVESRHGADLSRRRAVIEDAARATRAALDDHGGVVGIDATPGPWTVYMNGGTPPSMRDVYAGAGSALRAADARSLQGRKRNEWPHEPPRAVDTVRGVSVDFDGSRGREAYGAVVGHGAHEVRGHYALEPGADPRLPTFVPTALYRIDAKTGRRHGRRSVSALDLLDYGIDDRFVESIMWSFRERLLSTELCSGPRSPGRHGPGSCASVGLLSMAGDKARDTHDLRLRHPWPEGVTSLRTFVNRQPGSSALTVTRRKPNRYTVSRDDESRSRPYAVYDAGGDVVHRAATQAEAEEIAAEENRVLMEKSAARFAR